ncbi:hypothetical protein A3K63_00235 [Candidatus Micrarchaeota archaeon RBG_16_49_10]|nr:MAG: hypothetical protein A3K63_00235 [Candidatus Micrarchaeota archaeon RBG_16_49_10]
MKRILLALLVAQLFMVATYAISFYENPTSKKSIVFVSKYDSSSMDSQTYQYFRKIRENYSVYLVGDGSVSSANSDWKSALNSSDAVFVTSLSSNALTTGRDSFCRELSSALNMTKGVVFAGNSTIFDNESMGCVYTQYFDFANKTNNTRITQREVKVISNSHEISSPYEIRTYSVLQGRIYPVVDPNKATSLAAVWGDPDGSGPKPDGYYPFLNVWRGLTYKAASWGIEDYAIDCPGCLDWGLLNRTLAWVSDKSDIGFNVSTNKEIFMPGEEIQISVASPVDIQSLEGQIVYPDGKVKSLFLTGSGKSWGSIYLLDEADPLGKYEISVRYGSVVVKRNVEVKLLKVEVSIENVTESVLIKFEIWGMQGQRIDEINSSVKVTGPNGNYTTYLNQKGRFNITYNVSNTGWHTVNFQANYTGRKIEGETSFYGRGRLGLAVTPETIVIKTAYPANMTGTALITNSGGEKITNLTVEILGEVEPLFKNKSFVIPSINSKGNYTLRLNLSVPDEQRVYKGVMKLSYLDQVLEVPVSVELRYPSSILIEPASMDFSLLAGQKKTIGFDLENSGKSAAKIYNITLLGDLTSWGEIVEKPKVIEQGDHGAVKMFFDTSSFYGSELLTTLSGSLVIETEDETITAPISLKIAGDVIGKINGLYKDLGYLNGRLEEVERIADVKDLYESLSNLRADLETSRNYYESGDYEQSALLVQSVESSAASLKDSIASRNEEAVKKKQKAMTMAILVSLAIVAALVGYLVYRKRRAEQEFRPVYKKWTRK